MRSLERFGYRIDLRHLGMAILFLAMAFVAARLAFRDTLTLGYAMVIPCYIFLSFITEGARLGRSSFWGIRGWAETAFALACSAGVGYLGFSLWSIGY